MTSGASEPQADIGRRRGVGLPHVSIRGKIAIAFVSICLIVAAIGTFAVVSMSRAGSLLLETYDKPLMAISFARAIHADFAIMEATFARRLLETDPERGRELDQELDEARKTLADDLEVAAQRATSDRVRRSVAEVETAVSAWNAARAATVSGGVAAPEWDAIDAAAQSVSEQIDLLVNYAAGDGFRQRKDTLAAIEENRLVQIIGAVAAGAVAALVMFGLARRITSPVGEASRAAGRIADGELDVPIVITGNDELANLLRAMSIMRDRIGAMMAREVAQRQSAQTRLVDAIESSNEGVLLIDANGHVLLSNAEMTKFCGVAHAPQPGERVDAAAERLIAGNVFRTETAQQRAELSVLLRHQDNVDQEVELADGRWVRLSRSRGSDGGAIVVISDITLMKEREQVLREAATRAEAANRAKSEFLATMSHELRTPLNAIIGFSDIIASEVLGPHTQPQYADYARDVLTSGRRLLGIVNDILLLVKSESGGLELDLDETDLVDLVERCADSMSDGFDAAGIAFETGPHALVGRVACDETRMRMVIRNLLSNAQKFTMEGGRTELFITRHSDGRPAICARDTGIGMTHEDITLALSAFGQVDSGRSRRFEGAGLGLTLAKAIVDLHGGTLLIDSIPQEGTTVTVVLSGEIARPLALAS